MNVNEKHAELGLDGYIVTARAPGKIILSGEHSVIYGRPALAMAIDKFAETTIIQQPGYGIQFEFLNDKLKHIVSIKELQELRVQISKRYRKFNVGKYQIKDVIHNPLELIQYAFIYLVENLFLPINGGLKIQVNLTLPVGCGVGASAAVILSMIHALVTYCGQTLTIDKYLYFGREIENLQHGKSSGLDLFLSLNGGCHFFVGGDATKRNLPKIPFVLVNTGKPKTSTGECVEITTKHLQNSVLADDFAAVTVAIDKAIQQNDLEVVQQCIRANNELLIHIGVVPKKVANFIAAIEACGNVAKVSGAGAVSGDNAGIVLVVGENAITDIVTEYDYEILSVSGESSGLCLV